MSNDSFKVKNSLNIKPTSEATTAAGDIRVASEDSNRLKYNDGTNENYVIASSSLLGDNMAVKTDANGQLVDSTVTSTQLEYLSTTTSDVQTQINGKQPTGNYVTALTGDVAATGPGAVTATIQAGVVDNGKLADNAITDVKISATAAIQRSKIADGTAGQVVINDPSTGALSSEAQLAKSRGGTGADNSSVTFPASGVLVTEAAVETLTNKTIDGGSNTLTNVPRSGVATGTADQVLINDASGNLSSEAHLAKSRGGTGIDNSSVTFPTTGTIVTEAAPESLTNKTIGSSTSATLANSLQYTELSGKPASNPPANTLAFYPKSDGNFYSLNSSGLEKPVGSGTGGSKNYITAYKGNPGNGDLETGAATGFSLGITNVLSMLPTGTPTFGSGSDVRLSLGIDSSTPLSGNYSLQLVASAATASGNPNNLIATDAFTIDESDQAKILNYSVNYKLLSGATNSDWSGTQTTTVAIGVWDVTNSKWLPVSNPFGFIQPGGGNCSGYFQTAYNTNSLRLVIYGLQFASATTIDFDDFFVGPAPVNNVISPVTASAYLSTTTSYSHPIIFNTLLFDTTASYSTSTGLYTCNQSGIYRVSGVIASSGTPGIMVYKNGSQYCVAGSVPTANNVCAYFAEVPCNAGDTLSVGNPSSISWTGGNPTSASSSIVTFTLIQSAGTGPAGQVVVARASVTSAVSTTAANPINFNNIEFDSVAGITTGITNWRYTAQISGYYSVNSSSYAGATSSGIILYKNGTVSTSMGTTTGNAQAVGSAEVFLNAGEFIDLRPAVTLTPTNVGSPSTLASSNFITIALIQGPSSQQATPSIVVSANNTSGQSLSNNTLTTLTGWTKLKDSQNIFNTSTGIATIQMSGSYRATLQVGAIPTTQNVGVIQANIVQAGSASTSIIGSTPFGSSGNTSTSFASFIFPCVSGDTLTFKALQDNGGAVNLSTNAAFNSISIERVGN